MKKSIGRFVSILYRHSQIYINSTLKDFNITSAEYSFLLYLYRNDGASQDMMSEFLCIDKAATSRAVKLLEQKGYVIREQDERDRRFNRVVLTDKAKQNENDIKEHITAWNLFLMEGFDDETRSTVIDALEAMADKVEKSILKK